MKPLRGTVVAVGHKAGDEVIVPFVVVANDAGDEIRVASDEGDDAGEAGDFEIGDVVDVEAVITVRLVEREPDNEPACPIEGVAP